MTKRSNRIKPIGNALETVSRKSSRRTRTDLFVLPKVAVDTQGRQSGCVRISMSTTGHILDNRPATIVNEGCEFNHSATLAVRKTSRFIWVSSPDPSRYHHFEKMPQTRLLSTPKEKRVYATAKHAQTRLTKGKQCSPLTYALTRASLPVQF